MLQVCNFDDCIFLMKLIKGSLFPCNKVEWVIIWFNVFVHPDTEFAQGILKTGSQDPMAFAEWGPVLKIGARNNAE